ncbi:sensor histidine kinase efflux regulator BaeS [Achromobacter aloeverae]|uniref:Signal transduction histidine-protein kinase/phosphatase MprB n=1 Tax=Achromobacter aloeverae TaxID=1750518 RepID=A0A4Q1HCL7_9BURK|nr:sensor histidine kinase efflux regulator BaeS [Achromobacter aloeverae]RXN83408.1 sensor histidine kinase efflux regulator BaeS [Achromobacter aloeverae]
MKLGITFKLFLAILATCLAVTLAMGAAVRWNFERHFFSYVKEREGRRIERLRQTLADVYRDDGDWDALRGNDSLWNHLLTLPPPDEGMPPRAYRGRGPFDLPPDFGGFLWPPHRPGPGPGPRTGSPGERDEPPGGPFEPDDGMDGPPRGHDFLTPPFTLLDAQLRVVAGGNPLASAPRHAINVNGLTVGWLVTPFPDRLPNESDQRFQREQSEATWVIGILSTLLAAVVSILLARVFLAPVRRLARATHKLSAGDYATRVNVTSADELGRLGQDFNRLAHALERTEASRREMMADISHELRTPLAVLRGELEALQDGVRSFSPAALASLQSEVGLLSKLIDDLYDLSLADVGALSYRMEPVDMGEIAAMAADAFHDRMRARGLSIEVTVAEPGATIEGDRQRLMQLMNNLLENALRYTDPGGRVQVDVRTEGQQLVVECQDSAPGVPAQHLPRLFDRLYRVDASRSRESGGAGLGLAICQRIVESHRGTIKAMPSPLGGLAVRIEIPLAEGADHIELAGIP